MNRHILSARAEKDLREIWNYIALDNAEAADRFISNLMLRFPKLAQMPELGPRRLDLGLNLRSFVVGKYLIFYRIIEGGIEIVRVIHGSRKLSQLFE